MMKLNLITLCSVCCALLYGDVLADNKLPRQTSMTIKEKNDVADQWLDAAKSGDLETMQSIYDNSFFDELLLKEDDLKRTSLEIAVTNGDSEMVKWLADRTKKHELEAKGTYFNLRSKNNEGKPMMVIAAEKGHVGVVKIMLLQAMNPNNYADKSGKTSLMAASENGHKEVVELLLNGVGYKKADPNEKDFYKKTALSFAAENNNTDVARLLLNHGAKVNKLAISYAKKNENEELTDLLEEYKEKQDSKKFVNRIKNIIKGRKKGSVESFESDQTLNNEDSSIVSDTPKHKKNKVKTLDSEIEENDDTKTIFGSDESLYHDAETDVDDESAD